MWLLSQEKPETDRGIKKKGIVEFKSTAEDDEAEIPDVALGGKVVSAAAEQIRRSKAGTKADRGGKPSSKVRSAAEIDLDRFD